MEKIKDLLENSDFTEIDLEFIIKYLTKNDISPQLAMRRIKAFDKLQEKLNDTSIKDELNALKEKLHKQTERLTSVEQEYESLEGEKEQLETQSSLLTSESEELKEQLKMIQEMHLGDEEEKNEVVETLLTAINELKDNLTAVGEEKAELKRIFEPVIENIEMIAKQEGENKLDSRRIFSSFDFLKQQIIDAVPVRTVEVPVEVPAKTAVSTGSTSASSGISPVSKSVNTGTKSPKPVVKEDEPAGTKVSDMIKKRETKKEENKVDEKTVKVLSLFIDFIEEAENDEEFRKCVSAICDTDEAYETLGSIALSQVYSFKTKDMSKKDNLIKLLKSWQETGVPW